MLGWMTHKLESRLLGEISTASDTQMIAPTMTESEEELKSLLMNVKEDSEKAGLKLNIQKSKIMASVPISSGQIGGEKVEIVSDFISFHIRKDMKSMRMVSIAIKLRHLLLGRKTMTNLDSILKSRETLLCQQRSI